MKNIKKSFIFLLMITTLYSFCSCQFLTGLVSTQESSYGNSSTSSISLEEGEEQGESVLLPTYDISSLQVQANSSKSDIINGTATFKAMTVTNGTTTLNYRIYIPQQASSQATPVLFFFHGAGESAGYAAPNNEPANFYEGFNGLFNDNDSPILDSIVIVPQCPGQTLNASDVSNRWVNIPTWTTNPYSTDAISESKQLDTVLKLLKYYDESDGIQIDRDQIYAMGMSMGGFATWDLLVRHSDIFAAAIPICGGCDVSKASLLKDVPIYTFHGTADTTVYPTGTNQMVTALQDVGNTKVTYVRYEGSGHAIWNQAMATDGLMEWLYSQKLSDR